MKEGIKFIGIFLALLIPMYFVCGIICLMCIYLYDIFTGVLSGPGAGGLVMVTIPVGFMLSPIASLIVTSKICKKS